MRTGARPTLGHPRPAMTNAKSPYATGEAEQMGRQSAVEAQLDQWRRFLPDLFKKLAYIEDPRRPGSIRHRLTVVLFYGLLLFVFQYTSRREANRNATSPTLAAALQIVFPDIDSVPHFDTVERVLRTIPEDAWEAVLQDRLLTLLRKHAVQQYLGDHAWVVAIDGTQKFSRHQPFADEALTRRISETDTRYRVYLLEAVLVVGNGLTLPLRTEFVENTPDAPANTKQDSELNACYRMARRLQTWFPRRRLLLVMDGLYPSGPVMALCRREHWDWMIVLPRDSLKSVWTEVAGLTRLDHGGEYRRTHQWGDRHQIFRWVNAIDYAWKSKNRVAHLSVHVALCDETWTDSAGVDHEAQWAWISGRPLTPDNVVARCNRAGRHRWAIEAEFLVEKRHGDQFEHAYSYHWTSIKGWHYLMKIAHLLNVLTLWTTIGQTLVARRGYREAIRFLRDTWTGRWLTHDFLPAHQIGALTP